MKVRYMSLCYNALSHFYSYWAVFFSNREIDAMQRHSEQGDRTGLPSGWKKKAGEKTKQHKSKWNRLLQTQDMYLQLIRSNMGAKGNR